MHARVCVVLKLSRRLLKGELITICLNLWHRDLKPMATNLFSVFVASSLCAHVHSSEAVQDVVDMAWERHLDEDSQAYFFYSQVRILVFEYFHNFGVREIQGRKHTCHISDHTEDRLGRWFATVLDQASLTHLQYYRYKSYKNDNFINQLCCVIIIIIIIPPFLFKWNFSECNGYLFLHIPGIIYN